MSLVRRLPLLALAVVAATARAHADEPAGPAWAADVAALRLEPDAAKRVERTWALLAKKPDVAALRAELARPLAWKADEPKGEISWQRDAGKAGKLTVGAFVPAAYTPEKAWPVLLWLHGAVGRDEDGGGPESVAQLRDAAEMVGCLLLAPSGTKDTVWWSPAGVAHARAALAELARRYRVDPDRVAAAGFSDGASGCYHLLAHDPDPYACFLAAMGHPLITRRNGGPAFAGNCTARPTWAINGTTDQLFPADQIAPVITQMKSAGISIEWKALEGVGHDMTALITEGQSMFAFSDAHPRDPAPKRVDWETTVPALDGRRAWVEVLTVDAAAPGAPDVPSQPLPNPEVKPRPRLGIQMDTEYDGEGLRVDAVQPETPAAEAGFQPGDVIAKAGGTDLAAGRDGLLALRAYLDKLGDAEGEFTVKRGEQTLTLKLKPRVLASDVPGPPPAELGYGKPSGRVVAEVKDGNKIEVKTRAISALRLHLARPLVDPTKELVVVLNGKEAFRGVPKSDAAYLLDQALRGLPGDPLYEANLTLKP